MPDTQATPPPRRCPDCGVFDGSLRRAPVPWFINWAPSLGLLLLIVGYVATHLSPGPFSPTGTGFYHTIAFNGPGVGSLNFLSTSDDAAMTVAQVRTLASTPASNSRLSTHVLKRARAWGLAVPDRRLQVGIGSRSGVRFHTEAHGVAGIRGKSYEQRTYDDAPARTGPHQPEDITVWSTHAPYGDWFVSTDLRTHETPAAPPPGPPAQTPGQWYVTRSMPNVWIVGLAIGGLFLNLTLFVCRRILRQPPKRALIWAYAMMLVTCGAFVWIDSRQFESSDFVGANARATTFNDTTLSEADLDRLLAGQNPDATLANAVLAALPPDVADPDTIIFRWRERGPTKFTGIVFGGDTWLAIIGINNSLGPDGKPVPTARVPATCVLSDGSASFFVPTPEGAMTNVTFTIYLLPTAFLVVILIAVWNSCSCVRSMWAYIRTRSRRARGECVGCGYPLPAAEMKPS